MTKDIERFEDVFKKSIQTMHDVNVKQFGSAMANIMLPALEQMKPIFKIVYEQGLDDGLGKLEGCVVVPVEPSMSMVYAAVSTDDFNEHEYVVAVYKAMLEAARGGNE